MDGNPQVISVGQENNSDVVKKGSLLDKFKFKFPISGSFVQTFLVPGAVIVLVLLVGGGGTYLVASNVFQGPASSNTSKISESDISKIGSVTLPSPSPKPRVTLIPSLTIAATSPTPTSDPAAGWTLYSFTAVFLNFKYPVGWTVNVASTSAAPYLNLQNYSGAIPANTQNIYSVFIGRLDQVGITTVSGLTTQLALNAASNTFMNGQNLGQVSVISATPKTINGYQALERQVTYSNNPSLQVYELYVLDGISNVIKFVPQLDTTYGKPYFDILVKTIQFTNK